MFYPSRTFRQGIRLIWHSFIQDLPRWLADWLTEWEAPNWTDGILSFLWPSTRPKCRNRDRHSSAQWKIFFLKNDFLWPLHCCDDGNTWTRSIPYQLRCKNDDLGLSKSLKLNGNILGTYSQLIVTRVTLWRWYGLCWLWILWTLAY